MCEGVTLFLRIGPCEKQFRYQNGFGELGFQKAIGNHLKAFFDEERVRTRGLFIG
jgi:hypothetical protein